VADAVDVAIVGARAAGSAAAIALCGRGRSAALVDPGCTSPSIGETLPPEATPLLQQLGVWDAFTADGHAPAVCNESAWGSAALTATNFIMTPYGRGWHLDRERFDAMLRARARDTGARSIEGRVCQIARASRWQLSIDTGAGRCTLAARWIIDATGRAGWVAARCGVRRLHARPLTASAMMFDREEGRQPDPDCATLVETAPFGWFYTAPLPRSHRIAVCFTEPADAPRTIDRFVGLAAATGHVRRRLIGYQPREGPALVAAHSSALERATGDGWLAVGDAACAHDPVSSYGILAALGTALRGADAIDAALDGRMRGVTAFELRVRSDFAKYLETLHEIYAAETRWPESAFWRGRASSRQSAVGGSR